MAMLLKEYIEKKQPMWEVFLSYLIYIDINFLLPLTTKRSIYQTAITGREKN